MSDKVFIYICRYYYVINIFLFGNNVRKERLFQNGIMEKTITKIIKDTKYLLLNIHMGQKRKICNLCTKNILWKYNHNCSEGILNDKFIVSINTLIKPSEIQSIKYIQQQVNKHFANHAMITGIYCINKSVDTKIDEYYFDYTISFVNGLAYFIHISLISNNNIPVKIYNIISATEAVYNIGETEILYIEAMGGHILWHCTGITIETVDSLKDIVCKLSDNFVKIHRSYIVNKRKVKGVKRCVAIMENGDEISIPYKKYVEIREKLKIN